MKKYNYDKHLERVKSLVPTWEIGVFFLAIAMYYLSLDLHLDKFNEFNATVIVVEFTYFIAWFIDLLVLVFIKIHRNKKHGRETESTK